MIMHQLTPPASRRLLQLNVLTHPPYSPDLAPSDFYLFPLLKEHLRGRQYANDNDIIQSVEDFLEVQRYLHVDWYTEAAEKIIFNALIPSLNNGISALTFKKIMKARKINWLLFLYYVYLYIRPVKFRISYVRSFSWSHVILSQSLILLFFYIIFYYFTLM